jgi:uncharacterized protein (TIGR03546 family)
MLRQLLSKLLLIRKMLPGGDSPRRLALGVAMGLLLGLIPKANLTAVVISTIIFASTINIGTTLLTAAAVSMLASYIDPVTDYLGHGVLTHESLQPYWTRFFELPIAPWTDLNNTVVAGGLVLGILLFYPAYRLSQGVFQQYWTRPAKQAGKIQRRARTEQPSPESLLAEPSGLAEHGIRLPTSEAPTPKRRAA